MLQYKVANLNGIKVLLCDADGNLFPSEEPAFVASTAVTNRFMQEFGLHYWFTPTELRLATTGKNFRTTIISLAASGGISLEPELAARYGYKEPNYQERSGAGSEKGPEKSDQHPSRVLTAAELEQWVAEEKTAVTDYLRTALSPDSSVVTALTELGRRYMLACISSSASIRVAASLEATGLASFFPERLRFSAEDSLPVPTSKPDPAIYLFAGQQLKIKPTEGLAIEDSLPGTQAAIRAGYQTVGNLQFVPEDERLARITALKEAGVVAIIFSWQELLTLLENTNLPV
jgi:beta-phosphoglucomutase-like phosphatase (HAD superfamily)